MLGARAVGGGGPGGGVASAGGPWRDLMERYMDKQQREAKKQQKADSSHDERRR